MSERSTSGDGSSATPSPHTATNEREGVVPELVKEARRIEEDAAFSAKGHYNAAAPWLCANRLVGALAAIAAFGATASALKDAAPILTAGASVVAGVLTTVLTILNPRGMATRHQVSGDRYLDIRNRARIFSNVEVSVSKAREDRLVRSLKRLSGALSSVRQDAPQIPNRAYEQALTALEVERRGEYAVDKRRGGS